MLLIARLNEMAELTLTWLLGGIFAALICVVALQVLARNVLSIPMIWTLDLAQLLFAWSIFLGAGVAFRRGAHYIVDLWPAEGIAARVPIIASVVASVIVVYVLVWHGMEMTGITARRQSQSLGISMGWYFAPIPICGILIGLSLLEQAEAFFLKRSAE